MSATPLSRELERAWTHLQARGEMDKKLAKEQEKFRDFATHDMLAAADR